MFDGEQCCGNCQLFRPIWITRAGETQSSHCVGRKHNRYGSLVPGDSHEDKSKRPATAYLPVSANSNSEGRCTMFAADHKKVEQWRIEERKLRTHKREALEGIVNKIAKKSR